MSPPEALIADDAAELLAPESLPVAQAAPIETPASRPRRWAARLSGGSILRKGVLSLFDQAVVSATNFLTTVMLGRHTGHALSASADQELGLYTLGFTVVVLAICIQNALICAPYTLFGNDMDRKRRAKYAGSALVHQGMLSVVMSVALGLIGLVIGMWGSSGFGKIALVLAIVLPFILIREFVRRIAFAHLQIVTAMTLDIFVAVLQLGGLLALRLSGQLTAATAFTTIGLACAVAGGFVFYSMRDQLSLHRASTWDDLRLNWSFGRWAFVAQIVYLAMAYSVPWILKLIDGDTATGRFAACMNLVMIANPLLLGLNNFLSPHTIQAFNAHGVSALNRMTLRVSILVTAAVSLLCLALMLAGGPLLLFVYGAVSPEQGTVVAILALCMLMYGISLSSENGLTALNRPETIFWANLVGLMVTVAAGITLILMFGIIGAAVASLIGAAVASGAKGVFYVRASRQHARRNA